MNCIGWSIIEVTCFYSIPAAEVDTDCTMKLTGFSLKGRSTGGLSGASVYCVLFFVVDKLGITRTNLARRDLSLATYISDVFFVVSRSECVARCPPDKTGPW